ncbi:NAD-dependent epimerase/dehydratase [Dillenia turbinata]|uniref:NAD-dependent epimerase/dehydratase n=1 Tax=Dillenia turbinata TaxID=194707 RepID=A0AAN8UKH0_9MAGN
MEGIEKGVVCVTGGTGYIGSWLIMRLLEHGYTVHTTIRSDPDGKDLSYLTKQPGASERLHIFHADLNEPNSFDAAIKHCIGVFHVAHPIEVPNDEPAEVVTRRCVEGTLGLLRSCLNSTTVKRVVLTSSTANIVGSTKKVDIIDETLWTDVDCLRGLHRFRGMAYLESKIMTERAALEFADHHGLNLVTVLPSNVTGPFLTPHIPSSVSLALAMILGDKSKYKLLLRAQLVHIEDVVSAHIFLFENASAKGRYICSSHPLPIDEIYGFMDQFQKGSQNEALHNPLPSQAA